jgi:glyoxylate reductase
MLSDPISANVLRACKRLKVVANYAVGTNNIDLVAAKRSGITITHTPGVLTDATADMTIAMMLAMMRRLIEGDTLVRSGGFHGWEPLLLLGVSPRGRRLGIIGMGRIGRAVATRALAFGMEVVYHSHTSYLDVERELGAPRVSFEQLLATSHVVSIHTPLTAETRHMIDARALGLMRRGSYLINTSRGEVVDEEALADALASGRLRGAALDVFEREPEVNPRLLVMKNVVLLPHLGSATEETRREMARIAASDVCRVLAGEPARHPVTPPRRSSSATKKSSRISSSKDKG